MTYCSQNCSEREGEHCFSAALISCSHHKNATPSPFASYTHFSRDLDSQASPDVLLLRDALLRPDGSHLVALDFDIAAGDLFIENFLSLKISLLGSRRVARMNDTHGCPLGCQNSLTNPYGAQIWGAESEGMRILQRSLTSMQFPS